MRGLAAHIGDAAGKFEQRLAVAALELAERAETLAPVSDVAERARLVALLGAEGDLDFLNRKLCVLIADGTLSLSNATFVAHLRATTMEKLAVDQPSYAAYRRELETPKDEA